MISKIIFENVENGRRVELNQSGSTKYVFKNEDIDWGSANAKHNTYTYPGQVGSYISSTTVKERTPLFKGYVVYVPTKDELKLSKSELLEIVEKNIESAKEELSKIVNPLQYVKVIVGDYYLKGKPESSIKFGKSVQENNEYFCKFTISLYCNDPLFHRATNLQTILSGSEAGFHFPLILKNTGFIFGRRYSYSLINIVNDGDIPVGGIFIIEATGTVKNIRVENVHTGEFFIIYKTLVAGEKVIVNTTEGTERSVTGELGGTKNLNYFQYWGYEGQWLQFNVGTSLIGYSVEEGNEQNVNMYLELNTQKYSLKDM